ncbi:fibronectin type III domain-containing protein [Maribacter sp. 2308TA10-17]|uniref:fibronectin type III domain-containing protein n=1 Tax=Maribacter sp. 2308TA10-17 TaxID=3386276 RepID=UPI0039BD4311
MKNLVQYILYLICFLLPNFSEGQDQIDENVAEPKIVIKARGKQNSVLLRWGVNDKFVWENGNKYGYIIERATILRDGKPVSDAQNTILTGKPIKPKPLEEWQTLIEENDMAAVVAQALYGESFNTNNQGINSVSQIINISSETQQRFAFSMFAIDQDFEVAQYAGLGYVDLDVKPNEQYLYNIKIAAPEELSTPKETGLTISLSSKNILPKPYDFVGYYYNNAFILIWEYDDLIPYYNAYDLEKSEDGLNFQKVNKVPITKLSDTNVSGISFTDSIPQYSKKYWYRIKGKTIFNEVSPASDTVSVIAYKELLVAPEFKENTMVSDQEVILKWDFAQDEAWKLTGFDLLRANKAPGPYIIVNENLNPEQRKITYTQLQDINYFKIRAKGIAGDNQDSSPNMIQPIDSIPPSRPMGLRGIIDTLGVVKLSWNQNTELDLRGYLIFKANRPNQEFTRLNKQELSEASYTDTVNLKSFNEKVYYRIVAVDNRYNESIHSEILELKRPDKIPPANAIFTNYEIKQEGVILMWENSPSQDVVKHIIYRKQISNTEQVMWENIFETDDSAANEFVDAQAKPENKYLYTIVAVDNSGLESEPTPPISINTLPELIKPPVKGLYADVNRERGEVRLSWRYKEPNVQEIQIYKKEVGKEFSLLTVLDVNSKQFLDQKLSPNSIYSYGVKALFLDGSISEWSQIEVKY